MKRPYSLTFWALADMLFLLLHMPTKAFFTPVHAGVFLYHTDVGTCICLRHGCILPVVDHRHADTPHAKFIGAGLKRGLIGKGFRLCLARYARAYCAVNEPDCHKPTPGRFLPFMAILKG